MSENILGLSVTRRAWNGVRVGVTEFRCNGRVLQQLTNGTDALLSVVVEEVGDRCEPRLRKDTPCPIAYRPRQMFYAPAGLEVWGYNPDARYVKNVMLAFDLGALEQRLSTTLDRPTPDRG